MAVGRKTGGQTKGTPNRAPAAKAAQIAASGMTPLDYLLSVMRDEAAGPLVRLDATKAAAPYVHPRLASITVAGDANKPLKVDVMARIQAKLDRLATAAE